MQAMCETLRILTQGQGALVLTELCLEEPLTLSICSLLPTSLTHLHITDNQIFAKVSEAATDATGHIHFCCWAATHNC